MSIYDNNQSEIKVDEFEDRRDESLGICSECQRFNTGIAWCQLCDPQKLIREFAGSGNKIIDEFLNEAWLSSN
ncbi:12783_t:CDS:1, partial [Racocetra persica]